MKILYITNSRIPTEKAHGFQICKTCEKFVEFGSTVELLVPNRKNNIKKSVFEYYSVKENFIIKYISIYDFLSFLPNKLGFYLNKLLFLVSLFFKNINKNTMIYTRDPEIAWLFNKKGNQTVYNVHKWPKSNFIKHFLTKNQKIVCNSNGTEKKFKENGFINTVVAHNGVDLEDFNNINIDKSVLRKELNIPQNKKIIMYTGHLFKRKGIDIIIDTAIKIKDDDILFLFTGGTEEDLKKYKKKTENIKNVIFIGHKERNLIPKYLKSADILILPNTSNDEESNLYTSPIKLFEYMASNVPIIASDLPSTKEILNNHNSLIIESDNSEEFKKGIEKILSDKEFSKKISNQAREDVKKYTWNEYIKKIIDFL